MTELRQTLAAIPDAWIVGGAVRDRLLGRHSEDVDLIVAGDPAQVARAVARQAGGHAFLMSGEWGAWRVSARTGRWQVDVMALAGDLEADLRARDLTINAMAEPVGGGELVDPTGGAADLRAGILRSVSDRAFISDPLRTLRLVRLSCDLGFDIDPVTWKLAAQSSVGIGAVAAERIWAELRRILTGERALAGIAEMDRLGLTRILLPELLELNGVQQSRYHHLDVRGHTEEVLTEVAALAAQPQAVFGPEGASVAAVLGEPLGDGLTRGEALLLGAVFHDVAKARTRGVMADGRVTFMGHDVMGTEMATSILRRWRASERVAVHVSGLVRHHLRLGFLVHRMPLGGRDVHEYLRVCGPVGVDVSVLSCADRLATRGDGSGPAIARHLELARQVMPAALAWRADPPRPPVRGDELAAAAGVAPGPALGPVLAELEAAAYAGELSGRAEALERGVEMLRGATAR